MPISISFHCGSQGSCSTPSMWNLIMHMEISYFESFSRISMATNSPMLSFPLPTASFGGGEGGQTGRFGRGKGKHFPLLPHKPLTCQWVSSDLCQLFRDEKQVEIVKRKVVKKLAGKTARKKGGLEKDWEMRQRLRRREKTLIPRNDSLSSERFLSSRKRSP